MSMDVVNALFEFGGALLMLPSLIRSWRLGIVQGVHLSTPVFFLSWGAWNVVYYPHLGQLWSTAAGILLLLTNILWVFTVWHLTPRAR